MEKKNVQLPHGYPCGGFRYERLSWTAAQDAVAFLPALMYNKFELILGGLDVENYFAMELDPRQVNGISSLGLAHMGDGVFELLVRAWLCGHGKTKAGNLHRATVSYVSAPAQSRFVERMEPLLTQEEADIFRRGRNAHVHAVPKNASPQEYARATGLECLFGHLFLTGKTQRINQLFVTVMEELYGL